MQELRMEQVLMSANPVCFLDMDGVLADFVGGACALMGVESPYARVPGRAGLCELLRMHKPTFYGLLQEGFWAHIKPTSECFDIVAAVEAAFGAERVCILTKPIDTRGCMEGKRAWLRKHLPEYAGRFLMGKPKYFVAHPDAVLVDDDENNCDEFEAAGGHAILVPRLWNREFALAGEALAVVRDELAYFRSKLSL